MAHAACHARPHHTKCRRFSVPRRERWEWVTYQLHQRSCTRKGHARVLKGQTEAVPSPIGTSRRSTGIRRTCMASRLSASSSMYAQESTAASETACNCRVAPRSTFPSLSQVDVEKGPVIRIRSSHYRASVKTPIYTQDIPHSSGSSRLQRAVINPPSTATIKPKDRASSWTDRNRRAVVTTQHGYPRGVNHRAERPVSSSKVRPILQLRPLPTRLPGCRQCRAVCRGKASMGCRERRCACDKSHCPLDIWHNMLARHKHGKPDGFVVMHAVELQIDEAAQEKVGVRVLHVSPGSR